MRKNLVIVRAGDKSLHPQWLSSNQRTWDIAVSYYGDFSDRYRDFYDFLHIYKGSKWAGIAHFFLQYKDLINNYKYIWIPDDDILTNSSNIDNFFEACDILNLTIAQPSLTSYSFYSHAITIQNQHLFARITNFIEIMAPCFLVSTVHLFLNSFSENSSGWGLEWLWYKIAKANQLDNFGIIDSTPVQHTRPVGSLGHGGSTQTPAFELVELIKKYNLDQLKPEIIKEIYLPNK